MLFGGIAFVRLDTAVRNVPGAAQALPCGFFLEEELFYPYDGEKIVFVFCGTVRPASSALAGSNETTACILHVRQYFRTSFFLHASLVPWSVLDRTGSVSCFTTYPPPFPKTVEGHDMHTTLSVNVQ